MNLSAAVSLLALMPPASGQGEAPNQTGQMVQMLGMMAIFGFMFYFVLIRPQQKKQKEHARLLETLKTGDKVVTSSGILGVVVGIKDKQVSIRSADSKLEIQKQAISEVLERAGGAAANDK